MTNQEIRYRTDNIATFLEKKQLKNTFNAIATLIELLNDWTFKDKLEQMETTYKYMLRYMLDGANDPERNKVYNDLLRSTYELADEVLMHLKEKNDSRLYYESKRNLSISGIHPIKNLTNSTEDLSTKISLSDLLDENQHSEAALQLEKEIENISGQLFKRIWLSEKLHGEDVSTLHDFLQNKMIPIHIQSLSVAALTLALKEYFDKEKLLLLFDAYEVEEEEIRQRALVGILLILYQYDKRLYLYPEIQHRLQHLAETPSFIKNINTIIRQFILTKETEKISKHISEDLMPEMMKISPELSKKINLSDLMDDTGTEDKNPEWQNILEEAGLTDKIQEINNLQMEGADVMHSSFSNLKMYPFFYDMSNWFLPFTTRHSFLKNIQEEGMDDILNIFSQLGYMCNSDKYSLYFTVLQMPAPYRKMMSSQMFAEAAEMIKQQNEDQLVPQDKQQEIISNQYIHDLYRFYKVYPRKRNFEDIFASPLTFHKTKSIGQIISDKNNLISIGEYYFSKNQLEDAKEIFTQLISKEEADAVLFQKIGYCEQMSGNIPEALDAYLKSDLMEPSNSWTLKKIAACYRILKKPEEALSYYQKVEVLNPDNLSVQLNIGHCYLELKKYQEALKSYFKVEYLNGNSTKSWRPIAWCSFLTGKFDQAIRYYEQILNDKPTMSDYLNFGHALLAMGNTKEAIDKYQSAILAPESSREKFTEAFNTDMPELIQAGIPENDIPIVLDQVLYVVEK